MSLEEFIKYPLPDSTLTELFPRELLQLIPDEYPYSVLAVGERMKRYKATVSDKQAEERAAQITQAHAVFKYLRKKHAAFMTVDVKPPSHNHLNMLKDLTEGWKKAYDEAEAYRLQGESERMQEVLESLDEGRTIKLSKEELKDLQTKINGLQEAVGAADALSGRDKDRMFRTIRKLNKQLHEAVTSFAGYYGLIDEYLMLGKRYAEKARPVLDCIKVIVETVSKIQQIACGLGAGGNCAAAPEAAVAGGDRH